MENIQTEERIQENPLGTEPIGKILVRFAVPSIIAMMVSALYNMVDQFFIGRSVGMLGNAATNVAFPLTITCTAISLLCGVGGAANFNLSLGRKEKDEAECFAGAAVGMAVLAGIILCVIVRIFLEPLIRAFGATDQILTYSLTYTGITSFGFPFLILTTAGSNLIRADGSPKFSMMCTLIGAIINTVLDPLFIFGFDMGMAGAAWATVLGQVVSACLVIWYLLRFKTVKIRLRNMIPSRKYYAAIFSLGISPFCNQLAMMVVQIVMNNTLTYYGASSSYGSEIPLACAGIIAKVNMIFFSIVIGISQGMQPIVSFNYGAKNYNRVRETYKKALTSALLISMCSFLSFQIFPRQIIGFFGSGSEEYFHFAEQYFRIFLFFTFLNGIQPITANFFTAIGKAVKGVFLSHTRQINFLLPQILILPIFLGIDGAMYSAPIADFVAAVLAVLFVKREFVHMRREEASRNQMESQNAKIEKTK